jgi:ABC-type transporter Mla maintaining outer membrane lipid asymmetry ATPase subunit MlaF
MAPWIEMTSVEKRVEGLPPFKLARLVLQPGEGLTLAGFSAHAAELFMHLVTGAALPDAGDVRVAGRSTRDIATDTDWLASLDRFGIVTDRAVLLEGLTVAANLALPMTLAIDPLSAEVRADVERLAAEVDLARDRLDATASALDAEDRWRLHLARALAVRPDVLLLERPTSRVAPAGAGRLGSTIARLQSTRGLAWIALTDDDVFARAAGGQRFRLIAATGALYDERGLWTRLRAKMFS